MPSGKTVKLVLLETLQFAAVCVPLFVVMERFARLMRDLKGQDDRTAYWLVVAASLAYVTSATLLVWVPVKYLLLKRGRFSAKVKQWRPAALAYVIVCPLPCFALLIAASKVQADRGQTLDHFTELPVSLVLLCLIGVDVVERIRAFRLTGRAGDSPGADFAMRGPVLTHLEQVTTITGHHHQQQQQQQQQLDDDNGSNVSQNVSLSSAHTDPVSATATVINGAPTARLHLSGDPRGRSTPVGPRQYPYSPPGPRSGPLRFLWSSDGRSRAFVDGFLFWLDTAEMLRAAADPGVFYSPWAVPVFTLAFLSCLRLAVAPQNPLAAGAGVALQDFPFFVLRAALMGALGGHVTPPLYAVKNLLVCLSYVYFTFLAGLVQRHSMF